MTSRAAVLWPWLHNNTSSWSTNKVLLLFGGIASCSTSDSAYCDTVLCLSVCLSIVYCLSVVCHIRAACLNRYTDLDAIWQVGLDLWGPVTYCDRWGSWPAGEEKIWGSQNMQLRVLPTCEKRWFVIHQVAVSISNSALHRITPVLVLLNLLPVSAPTVHRRPVFEKTYEATQKKT